MRQLVSSPDAFMERKAGQPNIRREVLTILIVGVLGSLGAIYLGQEALAVTDVDSAPPTAVGMAMEPVIGAFVLWIGYAVGLHVIAGRFDARGPIRRLLKTTAWALIPVGVGNLLRSAAVFLTYRGIDAGTVVAQNAGDDPVEAFAAAGTGEPLYLLGQGLLLLGVLWSGYLMTYAVQSGKDLGREDAFRAAAIPVAIHVLYVLWTTVQSFGLL